MISKGKLSVILQILGWSDRCPFCFVKAPMRFGAEGTIAHCTSCRWTGDCFKLLEEIRGLGGNASE